MNWKYIDGFQNSMKGKDNTIKSHPFSTCTSLLKKWHTSILRRRVFTGAVLPQIWFLHSKYYFVGVPFRVCKNTEVKSEPASLL